MWLITAVAFSVLVPAQAAPSRTLLVLPVVERAGVASGVAPVVNAFLATEARRLDGVRALTVADVEQMLSVEQRRQLMGCDAVGCMADIAGALSSDEVLHGSLARLSSTDTVLTLTRLDARRMEPLASEAARLPHLRADAVQDALGQLLLRLYPSYQPREPRTSAVGVPALAVAMTALGLVMQWGAFTTVFTTPFWGWACPPAIYVIYPLAVANFLAQPILTSYALTAMADLLGRRVAPWRTAMQLGVATLVLGFVAVPLLQVLAGGVGAVLALPLAAVAAAGSANGDPAGAAFIALFTTMSAGIMVAGMATMPAILALITATVVVQVVTILRGSRVRTLGEEPRLPTLYTEDEKAPGLLGLLPRAIIGGSDEPLEEAEEADPPSDAAETMDAAMDQPPPPAAEPSPTPAP